MQASHVRRIRRLAAGAAAFGVVLAVSVVTVQVAQAAVACRVTYSADQWPGGFNGNVVINNLGDPLNGWTLTWTFTAGQTVTSSWGANIPTGTSQIRATNAGWNGSVPSGGSVSFGFSGTWNNSSNPAPTNFALNGVACNGSTNPPTTSSTSRPPTTTTSRPPTTTSPPSGQTCTAFATITMGKYWINNNLWGQSSGTGSQCISSGSVNGNTISWSTNFNWANNPSQVKSYASSVLGWHWGWMLQNTGLPVQISANRNVNTSWQFQVNASGTFNVAYDCWFHTFATPGSSDNPTDELMIWPYRAGGAGPAGSLVTRVTIAGTQWDLYRGVVGSWNVWSYIRVSNATSVSFNIRDFIGDMVSRGMQSSKYLTSVEAGTEVFVGSGTINTTSYSANVS